MLSESKVSDNAVVVVFLPQEDVFRLQIAMHNIMGVHNFETFQNALHHHFDLSSCEFMPVLDLIVELSALKQLDTDVN